MPSVLDGIAGGFWDGYFYCMKSRATTTPTLLFIILANAVPVYGAFTGRLFFFQLLYLYWFESILLIVFDDIRIAVACGEDMDGGLVKILGKFTNKTGHVTGWRKIEMIVKQTIGRMLLLGFYLIFIIAFIALQVTGPEHHRDMLDTVLFRNTYFNSSLGIFLVSMMVQLLGSFLLNGAYRHFSPYNYYAFVDGRTILIHVMTVIMVFVHQFFFEHKTYAAKGEIAYIAIFSLGKTLVDVIRYRQEQQSPRGLATVLNE